MSRGSREATGPIRVVNLVARYWEYAKGCYVDADGNPIAA